MTGARASASSVNRSGGGSSLRMRLRDMDGRKRQDVLGMVLSANSTDLFVALVH